NIEPINRLVGEMKSLVSVARKCNRIVSIAAANEFDAQRSAGESSLSANRMRRQIGPYDFTSHSVNERAQAIDRPVVGANIQQLAINNIVRSRHLIVLSGTTVTKVINNPGLTRPAHVIVLERQICRSPNNRFFGKTRRVTRKGTVPHRYGSNAVN